jgi:hypothetical protein
VCVHRYFQGNSFSDIGITNVFNNLPDLEILFLHNNELLTNISEHAFDPLPKLKMVLLHFTSIYAVPEDLFANLPNIQYIWLDHSNIHDLGIETFTGLNTLLELQLDHNHIPHIYPGQFKHLNKLSKLTLSHNPLGILNCCQMCGLPSEVYISYVQRQNPTIHCGTFFFIESYI